MGCSERCSLQGLQAELQTVNPFLLLLSSQTVQTEGHMDKSVKSVSVLTKLKGRQRESEELRDRNEERQQ